MAQSIPSFFVYGEPDRPIDVGFMHVETVMARQGVHLGQVSPHKHDQMAQITFWTKGRGRYFLEERILDFSSPAISFVPSGVVHGFEVEPAETDAIVVSIADSSLPPIQAVTLLSLDLPLMVTEAPESPSWQRIRAAMEQMADEYREGRPGTEKMLASLAASVLTNLARLAQDRPAQSGGQMLAMQLRRLVDRHFRENWPVECYIKTLCTTPHLLSKACRTAFGLSVKELINRRRLLEAKRLLRFTIRSTEDIAFEIGLKDAGYFSRFFKRNTGLPPNIWRREHLIGLEGIETKVLE